MKRSRVFVLSSVLLMLAFQVYASPPSYLLTDLGSLGWATPNPRRGSVPGTTEYARTASGEVGSDTKQDPNIGPITHAYLFRNQSLTDLGVLPGALSYTSPPKSVARALNSAAHVVGLSDSAFYHSAISSSEAASHAVLWNGAINDLGSLSGDPGYMSMAEGINDWDEVVGFSEITLNTGAIATRAFVWIAGKMYNLSFYTNAASTVALTDATAINCQGQISAIGFNRSNPTQQHSYLLTRIGASRSCP